MSRQHLSPKRPSFNADARQNGVRFHATATRDTLQPRGVSLRQRSSMKASAAACFHQQNPAAPCLVASRGCALRPMRARARRLLGPCAVSGRRPWPRGWQAFMRSCPGCCELAGCWLLTRRPGCSRLRILRTAPFRPPWHHSQAPQSSGPLTLAAILLSLSASMLRCSRRH